MKRILSVFLLLASMSIQAGLPPTTLSGQSQSTKPTTFSFQAPYNQATQVSGVQSLIETNSENRLVNPGFEGTASTVPNGWTCTVGTCTKTTTAGEFSSGLAAMKVALSAQAMNVSQTVTTNSGIVKQGYVRVFYRVPSTMADIQICSLVDAAEQTCIPSSSLVLDDTFRVAEIPLTFGSTSAGIKFKTTSSYTGNAYFDGSVVAQGLGTTNIQLDNTYSAQVTTTSGAISNQSKTFIASCTAANTTVCTFTSGIFTVTPNCTVSYDLGSNLSAAISSISATGFTAAVYNTSSAVVASQSFRVNCQKSGNDYLAASSSAYTATSANSEWEDSGLTTASSFVGFGTPSAVNIKKMRIGSTMYLRGQFTAGTMTSTEYRIPIPGGLTIAPSNRYITGTPFGTWAYNAVNGTSQNTYFAANTNGAAYFNLYQHTSALGYSIINTSGPLPGNGSTYYIDAAIPIAEWSNASYIVGSFQDVPTTPGLAKSSIVSAVVSGTEVITENESAFITSCTDATPSVCTLTSSFFTATPKCWANPNVSGTVALVSTRSTSSISIERTANTTAFTLFCQGAR